MAAGHVLVDLLDETIAALALMSAEKLEALGERVELLSRVNVVFGRENRKKALNKKRVFEILLKNSESHLRLLERLYERGTTIQWEL